MVLIEPWENPVGVGPALEEESVRRLDCQRVWAGAILELEIEFRGRERPRRGDGLVWRRCGEDIRCSFDGYLLTRVVRMNFNLAEGDFDVLGEALGVEGVGTFGPKRFECISGGLAVCGVLRLLYLFSAIQRTGFLCSRRGPAVTG